MRSAIYSPHRHGLQLQGMVTLEWHIGDVVRKLRDLRRFDSQAALGKAAGGLDKGTVNRLETRGEASSTDTIRRVAGALKVEVGELYNLVPRQTVSVRGAAEMADALVAPAVERLGQLHAQVQETRPRDSQSRAVRPETATRTRRGKK